MPRKIKRAQSIMQSEKECYLCRIFFEQSNVRDLEVHHCLHGTANRRRADELGMWVWLCPGHHRTASDAVHRDAQIDLGVKKLAQAAFENKLGTREEFLKTFGKSYLP